MTGVADVIRVIVGMLVLITILLGLILWGIEKGLEWLAELTRASGQANVRELQNLAARLDEIERHTARSARPFYDADEDRIRHPERYDSNL